MNLLSKILLGNGRTQQFYSEQYEQVFDRTEENKIVTGFKELIKRMMKRQRQTSKIKMSQINFFAGPNNVFDARMKWNKSMLRFTGKK